MLTRFQIGICEYTDFWQSENAGITFPAGCLMEAFQMSVTKGLKHEWSVRAPSCFLTGLRDS